MTNGGRWDAKDQRDGLREGLHSIRMPYMMKVRLSSSCCVAASAEAQQSTKPPSPIHPDSPKAAAVKLSATTFRIGEMTIDTAAKTLSIAA